ncbi:MAG: polyprenol phosphomannose-dependent alpha 1,6 mannosyltransferase MptB [Micropruina sp.]|nr:polyprenol phosphomannose-dependent alpha 1,6 mannosyltransferase MptB [Micropruina sp.]
MTLKLTPTIRRTLTSPSAALGALGAALAGIGQSSHHYAENPDGWPWPPLRLLGQAIDQHLAEALTATGLVVLIVAWWLAAPRPGEPGQQHPGLRAGLLLAVWGLPLLFLPPTLSADPWLYADAGWIAHLGQDPYRVGLGGAGGPYAASVDPFWQGHGVAYPPLTLLTNRLGVELMGLDPYFGMVGQRVVALVGVALLLACLPGIARALRTDPDWVVWLGVLNPLLVLHFVGGAHNDALMAGVVALALWLATRYPSWWVSLVLAPMVVGLAMGLKQQSGLAVVAVAGWPVLARLRALAGWPRIGLLGWRSAVAGLVAIAVFIGTSLASGWGFGWTAWLGQAGRAGTISPTFLLFEAAAAIINPATEAAETALFDGIFAVVALTSLAAMVALLLFRAADPIGILAWGSVLVVLTGQATQPWYLVLSVALLACARLRPRTNLVLLHVLTGYLVASVIQFTYSWPQWVAVGVGLVAALAARSWLRQVRLP